MLILIDQDGVIADFEQGVQSAWRRQYGKPLPILPGERKNFYIADDLPHLKPQLYKIYGEKNFFKNLPPIQGALEALHTLLAAGHDVRICTAPIRAYKHCVSEKFAWVEQHLGTQWVNRIILTKDKTWVRGDLLIDDKPDITGSLSPVWQHWIYDQPYNRTTHNGVPRICWTDQSSWQVLLNG